MNNYGVYKQKLREKRDTIYILHYACSDINRPDIEISSICIFKINNPAPFKQFSRTDYPDEKEMLKEFWDFITEVNPIIVGWNINKPNIYGLDVLQKRYNQLYGSEEITILPEAYDLDFLLETEYNLPRYDYSKLYYYAKINNCTLLNYQTGATELDLLRQNKFKTIDMSVQRKCSIIADLLEYYLDGRMKFVTLKEIWEKKLFVFVIKQSPRLFGIWFKSKLT